MKLVVGDSSLSSPRQSSEEIKWRRENTERLLAPFLLPGVHPERGRPVPDPHGVRGPARDRQRAQVPAEDLQDGHHRYVRRLRAKEDRKPSLNGSDMARTC